jgi:hypothetical protein
VKVLLVTRELLFRSKLRGVVEGRGGEVTRDGAACELAVIELETPGWEDRIAVFAGCGKPLTGQRVDCHVRYDRRRVLYGGRQWLMQLNTS